MLKNAKSKTIYALVLSPFRKGVAAALRPWEWVGHLAYTGTILYPDERCLANVVSRA